MKIFSLIIVAAVCIHLSHLKIQQLLPGYLSEFENKRLVMQPWLAKAFTMGFNRTLADYYWLIFLQYYGDRRSATKEESLRYAPNYLRLIVALDPKFTKAYWFISFAMGGDIHSYLIKEAKQADELHKEGEAKRLRKDAEDIFKQCSQLLDEGIRQNPDDWNLPYIAGMSQYLSGKNANGPKGAAYYYTMATRCPGCPPWMARQAEIMNSGITDLYKTMHNFEIGYLSTNDSLVRKHFLREIQLIYSQVYYQAPTDGIKRNCLEKLKLYGLELMEQKGLPILELKKGDWMLPDENALKAK